MMGRGFDKGEEEEGEARRRRLGLEGKGRKG